MRIFGAYPYGEGPRAGCYWDQTVPPVDAETGLAGDVKCDVAVIGGGFTGLSAAIHLAEDGADVVLLEAHHPGWGASGRNGGFCCLGGGMLGDAALDRAYGKHERLRWRRTEVDAVAYVDTLLGRFDIAVDRHSLGETCLAHRPCDFDGFEQSAARIAENYNVTPDITSRDTLADQGMAGPFYGALTIPVGFALNPRKYLNGLVKAARTLGVRIFGGTRVHEVSGPNVKTPNGHVHAAAVLIATNGYSDETIPAWLAGRYMPTQSSVLVTEPIPPHLRGQAGWTSAQMAYDTRHLLHYFRLLPDGRFLFGMRGGLGSSPQSDRRARSRTVKHFHRMFPAWAKIEINHTWSGFVCLARNRMPFVGAVPDRPGQYAALAYHGNGVAMGTYCGAMAAKLISGGDAGHIPAPLAKPLARFPLGRARRALLPFVYAGLGLGDL